MNKIIKNRLLTVASCVLSAAMCFGTLAACGNNPTGDSDAKPEHIIAVPAACTTAGNIEYWKKDGKYYSDEACTTEITQAQTVINALNHDFTGADYVTDDTNYPGKHWQVCIRTGCGEISDRDDHTYTDGTCVCGKENVETPTPAATYNITVNTATNGTVTANKTSAEEGETVTITVTPDSGYELATLVYNDGEDDHDIKVAKSFTMPAHAVSVTATFTAEQGEEPSTFDPNVFDFWQYTGEDGDGSVDLGADWEKTENSVKVSATNPDGTDWHIKLTTMLDDVKLGHYYEITYTIASNVDGELWFESDSAKYPNRKFDLQEGANTVKYRFAVGKVEEGKTNAVLLLGKLPADFEVEVTGMTYSEVTADLSAYTLGYDAPMSATLDYANDNKEFTIEASGSSTDYHLKVNQNLPLEAGKTYEIMYVFTSDKSENTCFEVSAGEFEGGENGWHWADAGVNLITVRFTATATAGPDGQYTCFKLGQLAGEDGVHLTFTYIEFKEV